MSGKSQYQNLPNGICTCTGIKWIMHCNIGILFDIFPMKKYTSYQKYNPFVRIILECYFVSLILQNFSCKWKILGISITGFILESSCFELRIAVTKPSKLVPPYHNKSRNLLASHRQYCHLLGKQVKKSSRSKTITRGKSESLVVNILLRMKHHTRAWVHWHCQSCSIHCSPFHQNNGKVMLK